MKLPIAALVFAVLAAGCAGRDVRGPFQNQYIDAETGEPIQGVAFLAVWHSTNMNFVDGGGESFYDAQEAVSGPDGIVEIAGLTGLVLRPNLNVRFHAFAAGYDYATDATRMTPSDGTPYIAPTVTRMKRLTSQEERCDVVGRLLIPSIPADRIQRYAALVHEQRSLLKCGLSLREQGR